MRTPLRYLLIATLATFAGAAHAEDAPWYQIEVIVFENLNTNLTGTEAWPDDPGLPDNTTRVDLIPWSLRDSATVTIPGAEADTTAAPADATPELSSGSAEAETSESMAVNDAAGLRPFVALPDKFLRLNDLARRLAQSAPYRVLAHTGWRQQLIKSAKGQAVHISGGSIVPSASMAIAEGEPTPPLDGNISVSLSRYLHLQADLVLRRPLAKPDAPAAMASPTGGSAPVEVTSVTDVAPLASELLYRMTQSRRMRSTEIHYLDHPAMGVIAQIIPVKAANAGN